MPKRYEEEINEILHKFDDDWPPPNGRQRPRYEPPHGKDPLTAFGHFFESFGPSQLMLAGLVLILVGVVLHYGSARGLNVGLGGYATVLGMLVLFAGYLLAVVRGGSPSVHRGGQHMWRGQVIDLRPNNRGLGYWLWRLRTNRRKP